MKRTCPDCNGPLVLLTSMKMKVCGECHREWDWELDPNQRPLFAGHRDKRQGSDDVSATKNH